MDGLELKHKHGGKVVINTGDTTTHEPNSFAPEMSDSRGDRPSHDPDIEWFPAYHFLQLLKYLF